LANNSFQSPKSLATDSCPTSEDALWVYYIIEHGNAVDRHANLLSEPALFLPLGSDVRPQSPSRTASGSAPGVKRKAPWLPFARVSMDFGGLWTLQGIGEGHGDGLSVERARALAQSGGSAWAILADAYE